VIDIYSKAYDRAAAYTNLIMLGGYAGGFAIWNFTRAYLTARASAWTALLLLSSLTVFILFEIYKMVFHTRHGIKIAALLRQSKPVAEIVSDVQEYDKIIVREGLFFVQRIWGTALAVCVVTALAAMVILVWNFVGIITDPS
jgi:hypothetical protein